jgi:hypothetical protein
MKTLSAVAGLLGAAALLVAVVSVLAGAEWFGVTGGGYLRGSVSLFLLALFIVSYDRQYPAVKKAKKRR